MKLSIAKTIILLTAAACFMGLRLTELSEGIELSEGHKALFFDLEKASVLSDTEFSEEWRKVSDDVLIKILKEASLGKVHPLRSKKAAFKDIVLKVRTLVAGSEPATIHAIYIRKLCKFVIDIWEIKIEDLPKIKNDVPEMPEEVRNLRKLRLFFSSSAAPAS